jgi:hypothetical protein
MQKLFLLHMRRFCRIGKNLCISQEYLKIILTAHKNDAYRNILPLRLPIRRYTKWKPYCRKFVGICKGWAFQKSSRLDAGLSTDLALSIIQIKQNHSKSSSILFIIMRLLIFRPSINLHIKWFVLLPMI